MRRLCKTRVRRRRSAASRYYEVERRDGRRLAALTLPFTWSERCALAFSSKQKAEDFVREVFGTAGARMAGIQVVRS